MDRADEPAERETANVPITLSDRATIVVFLFLNTFFPFGMEIDGRMCAAF